MINAYCKRPDLIENYDKMMANPDIKWHCHHRLEEFFTREWLIKHNDYYDVSPNELIFIPVSEHYKLPHKGRETHICSEETKRKISNSNKGKNTWTKGSHHIFSEEHKRNISKACKGRIPWNKGIKHSDEIREKISKKLQSYKWYSNGIVNTLAETCPDGFVLGRLSNYKNRKIRIDGGK